jgi:hypothetical protein
MENNDADSGPELCFDVLVIIFRVLWADEHRAFIERNSNCDESHLYDQKYKLLPTVCKRWNSACRAAGLTGPRLDFPRHTTNGIQRPDCTVILFNKLGLYLVKDITNRFISARLVVQYRSKLAFVGIRQTDKMNCISCWTSCPKKDMTMREYRHICRRLGDVFGDEPPIAAHIMNEKLLEIDVLHMLLTEWMAKNC